MDGCLRLFIDGEILTLRQIDEDFGQFIRRIVVEMNGLRKAALQSRVRVNEIVHLVGITRNDTDELTTIILQTFKQRVDSLSAEGILIARLQRVSLIDEQYTTHRRVNELVGLDSRLTRITCHEFSAVGLYQLSTRQDTQRAEHICHDTSNGGFTCTGITREDVVLALEGIGFATAYLQVEECCQIGDFLLDGSKTNHTVEFRQALLIIDSLRSLVRNIGHVDGHHLLIGKGRNVNLLQTFSLLGNNLVEELTHCTAVGKVLVARVVELGYHLERQFLGLVRKHVFLLLGKDTHNLEQLIGRVVIDIEEIAETATHARIDTEQIVHLLTIAGSNDDELTAVVFHTFHQLLQGLRTLLVFITTLAQGCQRIGLINEEDSAHRLVTQAVNNLWRLSLIGADHLRTIYLDNVATIQISDGFQYLTQLTGNGCLTCTRITCQNNMNA